MNKSNPIKKQTGKEEREREEEEGEGGGRGGIEEGGGGRREKGKGGKERRGKENTYFKEEKEAQMAPKNKICSTSSVT